MNDPQMKPEAQEQRAWMRLDNAAHIYPASQTRSWTALFRVSMELTEPIDPDILFAAEKRTLARFPGFAVRLRSGLFWHYFETLSGAPAVQKDVRNPCVRIKPAENGGFMFRVRYYENRIAVEVFHALTDGTGGMSFLKTLVAEYLRMKEGAAIPCTDGVLDCGAPASADEMEDSFLRYARAANLPRGESASYPLPGTREARNIVHVTTGKLSADAVHALAKEKGASVNELLTALLILAIRRVQQKEIGGRKRLMPVKICVPVNMRRFYGSRTMRNFSSYVNPGIEPVYGEYTLEETIAQVGHYMGLEATEKRLNAKFSTNVHSCNNRALRATPLFLKNPTLKLMFRLTGDRQTSSILSNLGRISLPQEMWPFVTRVDFVVGPLRFNPVTCSCATFNDDMRISFCRVIRESDVERNFFMSLVRLGLHVTIESNRVDEEN